MKTLPNTVFYAGLLTLLAVTPLLATDTLRTRGPEPISSGWVSAPDASFNTRTYQDRDGNLVVQVNNQSLRSLTIRLQTLRGEEVAYVPIPKRQVSFGARLDVSELTDGDYRIIVSTDNEKIVKIVSLKTPVTASRQVEVAVVTSAAWY